MTFWPRLAVVVLASFAMASLLVSLIIPWCVSRVRRARPGSLATAVTVLRLLPAGAALLAAIVSLGSFVFFEPRGRHEELGLLLPALAALAALLIGAAGVRWFLITRQTRRLLARWLPEARSIELGADRVAAFVIQSDFPVVAVIGLFRLKLVIAQSVLDACTPEEIDAILAHEGAHIARHDNLWRSLIMTSPDLLTWLPISHRLYASWQAATEEAADDCAARLGDRGRALLAQALVKVARLAVSQLDQRDVPVSALFRGEDIERRVRRLLAPRVEPGPRRRALGILIALAFAALTAASLETVHIILETAVHALP